MGAAAEQPPQIPYLEEPKHLAAVINVAEMPQDQLVRYRATRLIGAVAVEALTTSSPEVATETTYDSLMHALQAAAKGDPIARKLVETNVRTDLLERGIKAGSVNKVTLNKDRLGRIQQFGQTIESVQTNSLRYAADIPKMLPRTHAEVRNAFRIENCERQDLLDDYYFVVFSRIADDMNKSELNKAGFFEITMSTALQVTTKESDGTFTTETALIAGTTDGSDYHGQKAVEAIGEFIGIDYQNCTAAETIDMPVLIHKDLMPNGVVDLVKIADVACDTFFGQAKPQEDYLEYVKKCREIEASFEPKVQLITNQLVSEAFTFWEPTAATDRLDKISEKNLTHYAVANKHIDPRVLGPAAHHIEQARLHIEHGNYELADRAITKAVNTAQSSSCASGRTKDVGELNADGTSNEDFDDGKIVKMTCPFCGDKNQYGKKCGPNQHCKKCDARVAGGKVVNTGNGGDKKLPDKIIVPKLAEVISIEEKRRQRYEQAPHPARKAARLAIAA